MKKNIEDLQLGDTVKILSGEFKNIRIVVYYMAFFNNVKLVRVRMLLVEKFY